MTMLISGEVDSKEGKWLGNTEGLYIMKKGSVCQEDITILNVQTPNNRALKYMKQKQIELRGKIKTISLRFIIECLLVPYTVLGTWAILLDKNTPFLCGPYILSSWGVTEKPKASDVIW